MKKYKLFYPEVSQLDATKMYKRANLKTLGVSYENLDEKSIEQPSGAPSAGTGAFYIDNGNTKDFLRADGKVLKVPVDKFVPYENGRYTINLDGTKARLIKSDIRPSLTGEWLDILDDFCTMNLHFQRDKKETEENWFIRGVEYDFVERDVWCSNEERELDPKLHKKLFDIGKPQTLENWRELPNTEFTADEVLQIADQFYYAKNLHVAKCRDFADKFNKAVKKDNFNLSDFITDALR